MNDWGKMIASYEEYLGNIDKAAQELGVDETTRRKILEIQEKMRAEQSQFNKDVEAGVNKTQQMGEIMDAIVSKIVNFAATVVIGRVLQDMWRSATSYASEYYDLMNQIRIVSGKTEAEADVLGKTYRQMAKDMKVTSQEIASAAVEFWRQGLSESEVEKRLEATIQYAKISDLEFKDAAELMTAATNTYGIAAQRVADVWAV